MGQPIISGFHPDPSICRVGDVYYIANSSFEYAPGVPIHRSVDLIDWELVGNALSRPAQLPASAGAKQSGIYAPTLRHHDGTFWLVTTDTSRPMRGQLIVHTDDPAGEWSDPVFVPGAIGIDPDLVWDSAGVCHLSWKSFHPELNGPVIAPLDLDTGELRGEPVLLWEGTGLAHTEGPHLYQVGEWWYLLVAEGGTERGHAVSVARSKQPTGPFEPGPVNPILTHRGTDHRVQNTGHGDFVQLADGSWAMVYLGVRPLGITPAFHVNGRETFLAGVEWVDGWPVVDEARYAVPARDHSFDDDFRTPALDPRWVSPGDFPDNFTLRHPAGLALDGDAERPGPRMLLTRTRDESWTADLTLDVSEGAARALIRIDDEHWYGVDLDRDGARAVLAIGPAVAQAGGCALPDPHRATVRLRAHVPPSRNVWEAPAVPDLIELGLLRDDGSVERFGSFDGRYLSTEVAGGFTGRLFGVEALSGRTVLASVTYRTEGARS